MSPTSLHVFALEKIRCVISVGSVWIVFEALRSTVKIVVECDQTPPYFEVCTTLFRGCTEVHSAER
jgi:hypothetical protein